RDGRLRLGVLFVRSVHRSGRFSAPIVIAIAVDVVGGGRAPDARRNKGSQSGILQSQEGRGEASGVWRGCSFVGADEFLRLRIELLQSGRRSRSEEHTSELQSRENL